MKADFDIASRTYDSVFTFSNIGKAQRDLVFKYINPLLKQGKKLSILELNCGTGADAIEFGALGHKVIATDLSKGMIETAIAKPHRQNVTFQQQDINTLAAATFNETFDFIFSNFGGLNCLSQQQLLTFFKETSRLLKPKGKLILVIMPKNCLWEYFYFSIKCNFKKAKRRNTNESVMANVDGISVETWYYNPKDIVSLTTKSYRLEKIKPIGLAIPPSYFEKSILAKPALLSVFKGIDTVLTNKFWAEIRRSFFNRIHEKPVILQ
ncbi:class I SAM-dependent methyltransferase [Lacinutrix neustonica]|uniref:Class I SAM-dependent methyltransferase n=1 Tax=Lacinutrix neustonica TaxID=2980107 RepID=A0A9E8SIK6_9FLAO|nr:class I SAM-dependent methyltransferase [Lacinutrix neustonica]WAC03770.1 class I SAM-dependent methyltransferase [Lacinutrix neustonica]